MTNMCACALASVFAANEIKIVRIKFEQLPPSKSLIVDVFIDVNRSERDKFLVYLFEPRLNDERISKKKRK